MEKEDSGCRVHHMCVITATFTMI